MKNQEIKKDNRSISRPYLIFAIIFGILAAVVIILIIGSGIAPQRAAPSVNPYYSENVNYPPRGTEKVGLIVLLIAVFVYLLTDSLFAFRWRGWKKSVYVVIWILLIVGSMEYAMGAHVRKHPPLHRPHPAYLWELFPGHEGTTDVGGFTCKLKVNGHGFRGDEVSKKKPADTFRIMILGDSSAFGYGVNQNEVFANVLGEKLGRKYRERKIEVINAAVPGYTTFSTLIFFRGKGVGFDPDAIIISHNNDPDFDWDEDKNRASQGYIQPLLRLFYRSNIYMCLRREILNAKYRKKPHLYESVPEDRGVHRVSAVDFRENLNSIMDIANDRGMKILVISMPRKAEEFEDSENDIVDDNKDILIEEEDTELYQYRKIMKEVTEEKGGIFLDLLRKWHDLPADPLFLDDMHPTVYGHEKISNELLIEIERVRWIQDKKASNSR
ncbi:MAG: hypothetical protein K8T10_17950 [Candidatus Eremiobacteraeota bacterium]|nr:hypothetical protein [Candidatus Eremiobacteraeota bacterium]